MPGKYDKLFRQKNKSYKMLLVLSFLDLITEPASRVPLSRVAETFQASLANRERDGLPVDRPPQSVGTSWVGSSLQVVQHLLQTPLDALTDVFEPYADETIGFTPKFLAEIGKEGLDDLREAAENALEEYWASLDAPNYTAIHLDNHEGQNIDLHTPILQLMERYLSAKSEPFAGHSMHEHMRRLAQDIASLNFIPSSIRVKASIGQGNWASVPWIALMDSHITTTTREGVYVCYLFADDMSACYLTIARGVTKYIEELGKRRAYQLFKEQNERDRAEINFSGMCTDDEVHLSQRGLGRDYEASVIAYIRYTRDSLPSNEQLLSDLQLVLVHYRRYVAMQRVHEPTRPPYEADSAQIDFKGLVSSVERYVSSQGFTYQPEVLANFLISLKVRPFVILAGISGTGKSKLVAHVARALGATRENGRFRLIPVRPDWSDPSDLLGYRNLQGDFVPGPLTEIIEKASQDTENPYFVLVDEMNLARVEYYLSDVLSVIETQRKENGRVVTDPVLQTAGLNSSDKMRYGVLMWPANLLLVGTVNMDETTHPLSKKVLDRATTIEFNHVDLQLGLQTQADSAVEPPAISAGKLLQQDYLVLRDIPNDFRPTLERVIANLSELNGILQPIGAQVGYRVRDVVSFFVVYALRFGLFTEDEAFDIQLLQKILPRLQGSTGTLRKVLVRFLQFCVGQTLSDDPDVYAAWLPGLSQYAKARYPRSAAKVAYMLQRIDEDGFTSYWLT